ncbi:MAG TPA: Gfo/Idh/MocA family oxidoreductase [Fibrobacteria bacterium]|nr:Gfo/Idh/MocA family oxidoreductase [Fibrobacteria bacterium]
MLKAGIIGAGRMGMTHFALLGSHPQVEVAAVTDDSSVVTGSLSRYRPDIKLYGEYRKMLAGEKLDLVLICTPPNLHTEMIEAAVERDVSVFVEKPFTLTAIEARRILERVASKGNGTRLALQVGYVNRFNDVFIKAKALLDRQMIGKVLSFRSEMFGRTVIQKSSGNGWRSKRENGGGCLYDFGSHAIDLAVFFMGRPEKIIGSHLSSLYSTHTDDAVRATLLYPQGLVGGLYVNWSDESCRKPGNKVEILGEEGKIVADNHELKVYMKREKGAYRQGWNTIYITDLFNNVPFYVRGNEFTRQIYHFVDCVLDPGLANQSSFADAALTQEIIDVIFADSPKHGGL